MGRALGFIGVLIVAAVGFYIYSRQATAVSPGQNAAASPRATIDTVGVKNDLLNIARAERGEFALNGKYVSLDELISSGALSMPSQGRGPYKYSVETSSSGFRAIATFSAPGEPPTGVARTISVDDTLQVTQE